MCDDAHMLNAVESVACWLCDVVAHTVSSCEEVGLEENTANASGAAWQNGWTACSHLQTAWQRCVTALQMLPPASTDRNDWLDVFVQAAARAGQRTAQTLRTAVSDGDADTGVSDDENADDIVMVLRGTAASVLAVFTTLRHGLADAVDTRRALPLLVRCACAFTHAAGVAVLRSWLPRVFGAVRDFDTDTHVHTLAHEDGSDAWTTLRQLSAALTFACPCLYVLDRSQVPGRGHRRGAASSSPCECTLWRGCVLEAFRDSLRVRAGVGVGTGVLISLCVSTHAFFAGIDDLHGSSRLREAACAYVMAALRQRADAVRVCVQAMTEDSEHELYRALHAPSNTAAARSSTDFSACVRSSVDAAVDTRVYGITRGSGDSSPVDPLAVDGDHVPIKGCAALQRAHEALASVISESVVSEALDEVLAGAQPVAEQSTAHARVVKHVLSCFPLVSGATLASLCDLSRSYASVGEWMPASRAAYLDDLARPVQGSGSDVLSTMMQLFGSADAFADEYSVVLAEKLATLAPGSFDTSADEGVLELLKRWLGERALFSAHVMLADVVDSKRVSKEASGPGRVGDDACATDMLALSEHYWPRRTLQMVASQHLHASLREAIQQTHDEYARLRKPRHLATDKCAGVVTLNIASASGAEREIACSLLHASVLLHVQDAGPSTVAALQQQFHASKQDVLAAIAFWDTHSVTRYRKDEAGNLLVTLADSDEMDEGTDAAAVALGADFGAEEEAAPPEAIELWQSYVSGMLRNLGSLSVERIHTTLHMFAAMGDYPYEGDLAATSKLLAEMVRAERVDNVDGAFRLRSD